MENIPDPVIKKLAALQTFVNDNYVPAFIKACAEEGLKLESEADIAHALQLNGKFAALVSSGVSIDSLVDTIVSNLNVKHATDGHINISLANMNFALDAGLETAGIPVDPMNKAAAAENIPASDIELMNFLEIVD